MIEPKRIKDFEAEIEHLKQEVRCLNVKLSDESNNATILAEKLNEMNHAHKHLREENEKLKAEREEANSWDDAWKMAERITQLEKCLVNARKENAKLKCLVLHAMSYAVVSLTSNTNKLKPFRLFMKYNEAYRKAKKALKEK